MAYYEGLCEIKMQITGLLRSFTISWYLYREL